MPARRPAPFAGAGFAAFASTWVGLAIMVLWSLKPKYARSFHPFRFTHFQPAILKDILRLSVPSGIATLAVMTGFALFSMIISHLDALEGSRMVVGACPSARSTRRTRRRGRGSA